MKIKKLRKELKEFKREHGNLEVIIAGYHSDETADGVEHVSRMNPLHPGYARIW